MAKKTEKHIKLKILPLLVTLLLIILIIVGVYFLTLIPIKNIYITGNNYLTDQEIIELAEIENYPSFLKTTSSKIKKRLKNNIYVKNVKVSKKLFAEVHIEIEEKNILFRKEENNMIVLETGEETNDQEKYIVPILLNYIPDTKYSTFLKRMAEVNENVKTKISEIRYYPNEQDDDRFLLYMTDGNYVYLTLTKFKQINYYEEVLSKLDGKKGILYLDSGNHFQIMSN